MPRGERVACETAQRGTGKVGVKPGGTQIRKARVSDIATFIALSRRTISASYRPFLGDQAVDAFIASGAADQYVRENIAWCTVIVAERKVVGYTVCKANLIDLMMIDQPYHRRGLGTELLAYVEGTLFQRGKELRLESFEGNHAANTFYRKHGWRESSRYFDTEAGVTKIVFRKMV
jgi:GNAT superfamily N-acetyltransferase